MDSVYIMGISLYDLGFYFIIFSFMGWLMECCLCSYTEKKVINRGFLNGPYCPIYGTGMCMIIMFLSPFENNLFLLFLGGIVLTTILEYVVAGGLEALFNAQWWDYSRKKFNIKGRVCLEISLCWGVLCVVMVKLLVPFLDKYIDKISSFWGEIIISIYFVVLVIDCTVTVINLINLNKIMDGLTNMKEEFMNQFTETDLYLKTEELKDKYELAINEAKLKFEEIMPQKNNYHSLSEKWKERMEALSEELRDELNIHEFSEKVTEIKTRYVKLMDRPNFIQKRIISAFPNFKSKKNPDSFNELKEKIKNKINK